MHVLAVQSQPGRVGHPGRSGGLARCRRVRPAGFASGLRDGEGGPLHGKGREQQVEQREEEDDTKADELDERAALVAARRRRAHCATSLSERPVTET